MGSFVWGIFSIQMQSNTLRKGSQYLWKCKIKWEPDFWAAAVSSVWCVFRGCSVLKTNQRSHILKTCNIKVAKSSTQKTRNARLGSHLHLILSLSVYVSYILIRWTNSIFCYIFGAYLYIFFFFLLPTSHLWLHSHTVKKFLFL